VDELTRLQGLITLLRANGITRYETAELKLELGELPAPERRVDLNREGFSPRPERDPHLQAVLDRLPGMYSDPALFAIK
jgi:hypothetical protein